MSNMNHNNTDGLEAAATAAESGEVSKMTMEDLTIQDEKTTDTDDTDTEMSLDERMTWLRERVRGVFFYDVTIFFKIFHS